MNIIIRKIFLSLFLISMVNGRIWTQNTDESAQDSGSIIIPGPVPFSLDAGSAIYCINLLRNNRYMEMNSETGKSEIIEVDQVWSYFLKLDESYPPGHHKRYDIIVNGEPVNWDNSFIEYGGEMLNLRLLFLYRDQHPPRGLDYRKNP